LNLNWILMISAMVLPRRMDAAWGNPSCWNHVW
jgi:hypothetical protein